MRDSRTTTVDRCVIGIPDDKWGEKVHAVVVLKRGLQEAICRPVNLTPAKLPPAQQRKDF
jgi:acyl-CoA synthetase (AMP-forming)/AMP-acid ligase II